MASPSALGASGAGGIAPPIGAAIIAWTTAAGSGAWVWLAAFTPATRGRDLDDPHDA